jgi:FkbM family methyltransferase
MSEAEKEGPRSRLQGGRPLTPKNQRDQIMLPRTIKWLIGLNARLNGIRRSDLPQSMHKELARAALRLSAPDRFALPNPIRLMGYTISYFREWELRFLFHEIFEAGNYLFTTDRSRPLILDCGSNIGMSILFFKKLYPEARIIGFEPDPLTYERLRSNVEQNGLRDVALNNCALTDRDGSVEFYREKDIIGGGRRMSVRRERNDGERIVVPTRRLSSFISEEIDMLKLDVEGAETSVLQDLAETGRLPMIRQIHLEYHHHIDSKEDRLSAMLGMLEDQGFGYQIAAQTECCPKPGSFQDISLYCYRKRDS